MSLFLAVSLQIHGQEQLNMHRKTGPSDAKIFKQRLDHFAFGPNALKTFDQRYFENDQYVSDPSTIGAALIEIGGEGTIKSAPGNDDFFGQIAQKYNAPIFQLEHRFYGESQPFVDDEKPLSAEHLTYLSSRHAIADLVNFIYQKDAELCQQIGETQIPGKTCVPWMIAGGSYAGAVTAWITQQHPHLFAASISSSGVVNA